MKRREFAALAGRGLAAFAAARVAFGRWLEAPTAAPALAGTCTQISTLNPWLITGDDLSPNEIVFTVDDSPDEEGPDGESQTMKVAQYLAQRHISAVFFVVGCHFEGQEPFLDPRSWICQGGCSTTPRRILWELTSLGHWVGNHTQNHIPLVFLEDEEIRFEVRQCQRLLDPVQWDGIRLFRPPGFWWGRNVFEALYADPYLRLTGPLDANATGQGFLGDEWSSGDWYCYLRDYPVDVCGELYLHAVLGATERGHGSILLVHVRTEYTHGRDGSRNFPLELTTYLVERLTGLGYTFVPVTAIPEVGAPPMENLLAPLKG